MLNVFMDKGPGNYEIITVPQFKYVKAGLLGDLSRVRDYYLQTANNVRNQHILARLLLSLNYTNVDNDQRFVDMVDDESWSLVSGLGITSPMSFGGLHSNGTFYNSQRAEVFIAANEDFDVAVAQDTWRDLEPVRVLRHPYTDISLRVPDGTYPPSQEDDISVISINIPMLALQYRMWCREGSNDNNTIQQFIMAYPLTNMLKSHLDVAIFNRLIKSYNNQPLDSYIRTVAIQQIDYTRQLDVVIDKLITNLRLGNQFFGQMLASIPAVSSHSMLEAMVIPSIPRTRQVTWALIVARLRTLEFMLRLNNDTRCMKNLGAIQDIKVALRELFVDRGLVRKLRPVVERELNEVRFLLSDQ